MIRRGRDEYQGAVYHVIQKGKQQLIVLKRRNILLIFLANPLNNHYHLIKKVSRMRRLTPVKAAYAISAREQGYSLNQITCHIGFSSVAVLKYMSKK